MSAFFDGAAVRNRSFAEVLDDVAATQDDSSLSAGMRSFADKAGSDWFFSMLNQAASGSAKGRDAAFFDDGANAVSEDEAVVEAAPAEPISFDLDEGKIAAELGLASVGSVMELKRVRRIFARRYHPDLFTSDLQPLATARMQLANMLLDKKRRELEGKY